MENLIQRGFRVIRGPDWIYKNQDGGKGHAGTVIELQTRCHPYFSEHTVLVQWDSGDKGLYRAGYDQAFDLRILEMTTSTRRHIRIWCDGCNAEEIRGIRWRCSECYAFDLCTTCYMNDKHDTAHVFTRVLSSHKTSKGPKMLPRSSSPRIPLRGSFPGAKVVRHPQECKKLGSDEQHGKVVRHGQRPEENIGAWAMVEFSTKPERMDFTSIICTLPGSGGFVYDGHLPNLGDLEPVNEGDNVLVTATPPELEELHKRRGLWEPNMMKTSGKKGFVNRRTNTGDFEVTFTDTQETFAMNPAALRKLHRFCLGQSVLISDDAEMVQRLQFGHGGWKASMAQAMGRVGKVVKINGSDVTVCVKSKRHTYIFNSANLTPARISFSHPKEETLAESFQKFTRFLRKPEMDITLAVAAGDILSVECMLKEHPEWIHYEPRPGKSLLSFAEDVRMMKFLVEKGAFIESYDDGGCTPLMCAADVNNYEGVRYLLDQGADVDATNHLGLSSFALACAHGSFECAHYLLLHGADVNLRSKDDFTPLIRAIEDEGRTILDLILAQKEIDLKAVSSDIYMSAMHYAALGGNTYALTKLIEKAPRMVEAKQCLGNTPIFCAGYASSLKATEVLIKKGHCNVNVQTTGDQTCPLHLALYKHNFHMIEVLVKNGADPNIAIRAGDTCLQMAIDVVEELEAEDLIIKEEPFMAEMKKKWGHLGIKTNGDALLAYLVSHGGDLDRHNSENITVRESLQMKSKESLIHSLDKIQSLTRKDIARQQSSASQPLRNLTQNCPSTVAMDEPVPFNSKDFVAAAKEERNSPGKSSMRYSRAGRKVQPPKSVPEKSSPSYATKKECAAKSQDKSSTSSVRPEVKVQDTWNSPKKLPTSSARRLTKIQSVRNSPEKSPMGSAIPGTNLQSPGKPSEKRHGKEARNVSRKGAGDCRAQESKKKTPDKGELHQLQAELQRKDDELKTLRSKVKTLEHLVKKKISFACGHDFIRSIAELIPECPECSDPIASVANI